MKTCSVCKETKEPSLFGKVGKRCRACASKIASERYHSRPDVQRKQRERHYQKAYGVSSEQVDQWVRDQRCCSICEVSFEVVRFVIDHDHNTGLIRGLLCDKCNTGLGLLRDDPGLLRRAIRYLEKS